MSTMIHQLYHGQLHPSELGAIWEAPGYRKARSAVREREAQLLDGLTGEKLALYESLNTLQSTSASIELELAFSEGFGLGARLAFEVFSQKR